MYDLVSGKFKWNVWSWNFTAWAEAQDDVEVYVQWTKEKVWYSGWATATCEDLLWVWDYKDEQEILSGNVITKVGVAVLTGNESWVASSVFAGSCYWLPQWATTIAKSYVGLCSHFASASAPSQYARGKYLQELNAINLWYSDNKTTAVADLKQFLAEQYNAWTPVIVVYALENPTTLSVAWQSLSIPAWDSRIEIVEWSILDLPLYAKYLSTTE
jgi:hypothetical protein